MENKVKFIDLFAGIGGIRLGFENAFKSMGIETECVMTSEIKPHAYKTLLKNFDHQYLMGDITKVHSNLIPDFDFLLGGFPCQPFSSGGKRHGFSDTRGTLFFHIERILRDKNPYGFILENVEGLVKHDLENKNDAIGKTLKTILHILENDLGYKTTWKVLDSVDFGLPQSRKRIFIVGTKDTSIDMDDRDAVYKKLKHILESGLEPMDSIFAKKLLENFKIEELYGKSIKDKRGGENNIHSWELGIKGEVSKEQAKLLSQLFKERRKKHWAEEIGIEWMDGMPLTLEQINTFFDIPSKELKAMLNDLAAKGYVKLEHPKKLMYEETINGLKSFRVQDTSKPKGYNIVSGKLSFEINKVLDPNDIAPTLVATDISRLAVPDGNGLRRLTIREGLRLFGYPEWFEMPTTKNEAFDLLGNTVCVPVVEFISKRIAEKIKGRQLIDQGIKSSVPVCS